ncbi:hypothetical protein [Clostridium tagluense]|uniref:hypothetical protein n=1 Tax=Clostridium tagluense TaxID=360422 RepID=UPI001CF5A71A|nr:hypothetical protein [Clostridium tagluense]MCB2299898.1 hypothetical protein [Clostridium tagluense]
MEVSKDMLGYFIFGLNAVSDAGEKIDLAKAYDLVESSTLLKYLNDNYDQYWEWDILQDKYEDEICNLLFKYQQYIEEDSYRKFGIKNNGFIILSSIVTQILIDR